MHRMVGQSVVGHAMVDEFSKPRENFCSYCKSITRIWFSVVCTLIDNDMHHHSGQNVVDSPAPLQEILTAVMPDIVVDKSILQTTLNHIRFFLLLFFLFLTTISTSKKIYFFQNFESVTTSVRH